MVDLDIFITSRVKRKLVVFFVTYPAIKMHTRGLAKLLEREKKKNTFVFSTNTNFLFFKELQSMVMKVRAQQNVSRAPRFLENSKK